MSRYRYTPEEIEARRAWLADRIEEKRESIARRWDELVAPREDRHGPGKWMDRAATALTIYDGAVMGYKVFRCLNRLFFRRRR